MCRHLLFSLLNYIVSSNSTILGDSQAIYLHAWVETMGSDNGHGMHLRMYSLLLTSYMFQPHCSLPMGSDPTITVAAMCRSFLQA